MVWSLISMMLAPLTAVGTCPLQGEAFHLVAQSFQKSVICSAADSATFRAATPRLQWVMLPLSTAAHTFALGAMASPLLAASAATTGSLRGPGWRVMCRNQALAHNVQCVLQLLLHLPAA